MSGFLLWLGENALSGLLSSTLLSLIPYLYSSGPSNRLRAQGQAFGWANNELIADGELSVGGGIKRKIVDLGFLPSVSSVLEMRSVRAILLVWPKGR